MKTRAEVPVPFVAVVFVVMVYVLLGERAEAVMQKPSLAWTGISCWPALGDESFDPSSQTGADNYFCVKFKVR